MSTSTSTEQARQAHKQRAEREALDKIAERLCTQFPELPAERIVFTIQGRYSEFEGSRIRDFVPVLVERAVRADLSGR
jgi:hypothetical protein